MEITIKKYLTKSEKCDVAEIQYGPNQMKAGLKVIKADTLDKLNKHLTELMNLSSVKHDNLSIKLLDHKITQFGNKYHLNIITEYCERGNLLDLLKKKSIHKDYYADDQLKQIFVDFIIFFSKRQKENLSHRDIKPENIFVT